MKLSKYFLPVLKETPAEAAVVSHQLMLRSGMIQQLSSGIYNWLPLGHKVLNNIQQIIRRNMDQIGAIEMLMPCIQPAELWKESGRYEDYGKEMLRIKDRHENDLLFGPTNEEVITYLAKSKINSYKQLPKMFYHIQWKFRDEIRPRFGLMRAREFLMKDAYSFDIDEESAKKSYDLMYSAYLRSFRDMGLTAIPVKADTGPIGGDYSHEFHIIAETGESDIYYDKKFDILSQDPELDVNILKSLYAVADDKYDPENCPISKDNLVKSKGIEVGHIFYFGDKYSKPMNAKFTAQDGTSKFMEMGSYGIGVSRLVAAIIEANFDDKGIIWPDSVAPFKVSIINLKNSDQNCNFLAETIYSYFFNNKIDVLYDDTNESAGSKFATHDLIGSPWQIIIGPKNAADEIVELRHRKTGESELVNPEVAIKKILGNINM